MAPESKTWFEHTGSRHVYKVKTPDTYVVAAEVKAIGGDPLILHKVRILDAETGEPIGGVLTTDDQGVVRATVPKNAKYRIEIVEDELEAHGLPVHAEPEHSMLLCRFADPSGAPLAGEEVGVTFEDQQFTLTTDEDGCIDVPAHLGHYQLKVGDEAFDAHAVMLADAAREESRSHFVTGGAPPEEGEAAAGDPEARLARPDLPPFEEEPEP